MASRVTIVEDSTGGRMLLSAFLTAAHYETRCVTSKDILEHGQDDGVGLMLIGPSVPEPASLIQDLNGLGRVRHTPILVLSRTLSPDTRLQLIQAGARDMSEYPVFEPYLLARIRALLRETEAFREIERRRLASLKFGFAEAAPVFASAKRITLLQDRKGTEPPLSLGDAGPWIVSTETTAEALVGDVGADGYVLDWRGSRPQSSIRQALPELRARYHSRHAMILVVYDAGDLDAAVQALDAGASDAVAGNVTTVEMACRVSRLLKRKIAEDALRKSSEDGFEAAVTDPLTGLYNRRYAEAYMADLLADRPEEQPFAIMLADIDHFKSINDTYGHAAGDDVLRDVAQRLRSEMRALDLVARYGGEEFLIVLSETNLIGAELAANRLRERIGNSPVMLADGRDVPVTVSIGVCLGNAAMVQKLRASESGLPSPLWQNPMSELLRLADNALYKAKEKGRNRIQMAVSSA